MNVFIESNYILEMALQQQQCLSCETILLLAEEKKVTLILPDYCVAECYENCKRGRSEKNSIKDRILKMHEKLLQTKQYSNNSETFENTLRLIDRSIEVESTGLNSTILRLLDICSLIPLNLKIIQRSNSYRRNGMKAADAIIYASIIERLQLDHSSPSCFLNKNSTDFDDPDFQVELTNLNCKIFFNFDNASNWIQHKLS